jgi:hypothetical protein
MLAYHPHAPGNDGSPRFACTKIYMPNLNHFDCVTVFPLEISEDKLKWMFSLRTKHPDSLMFLNNFPFLRFLTCKFLSDNLRKKNVYWTYYVFYFYFLKNILLCFILCSCKKKCSGFFGINCLSKYWNHAL